MDRCFCLVGNYTASPDYASKVQGKGLGLVLTSGGPAQDNAEFALRAFANMVRFLKAKPVGDLFVPFCTTPEKIGEAVRAQAESYAPRGGTPSIATAPSTSCSLEHALRVTATTVTHVSERVQPMCPVCAKRKKELLHHMANEPAYPPDKGGQGGLHSAFRRGSGSPVKAARSWCGAVREPPPRVGFIRSHHEVVAVRVVENQR